MKNNNIDSKEDRFRRIASRRVQEVLDKLRLLGNCSNKRNYEYTDIQIKKIFSAIDLELRKIKLEFHKGKNKNKEFNL